MRGRENQSPGLLPWIGEMRFYNRQQREQLGTEAGLEVIAHHDLIPSILLTVFTTRSEAESANF